MRTVAIIQARMTSSRLPGKVLADLEGAPMLARVVARARAAASVDEAWVACTDLPTDDPIADFCREQEISCHRGSETDVLGRYVAAAREAGADRVLRLTADCPLLDPAVIDRVVAALDGDGVDYASNVLERSYPRGLDVEAFSVDALHRMDRLGTSAAAREHVTIPVRLEHPDSFATVSVAAEDDDGDLRWTVDTGDDLEFVRRLYRELDLAVRIRRYRHVVGWCRAHAELARHDDPTHTWDPARSRAKVSPETRR